MNMALLGASNATGMQLVSRALEQDYSIHLLTEHPELIHRAPDGLTIYKGSAESREDVQLAVRGCAYVVAVLDSGEGAVTPAMTCLVEVLKASRSLRRLVCVSTIGAGDTRRQALQTSGLFRALRVAARGAFLQDATDAEAVVRQSGLPYVILRTTQLTNDRGQKPVIAVSASDAPPRRMPRADVARFVMGMLQEPGWEGREVTVGVARERVSPEA